ncbi:hypothetical protein D3C81_1901130 [compost metagenome]
MVQRVRKQVAAHDDYAWGCQLLLGQHNIHQARHGLTQKGVGHRAGALVVRPM